MKANSLKQVLVLVVVAAFTFTQANADASQSAALSSNLRRRTEAEKTRVTDVAAGRYHTCVTLSNGGGIKCFGNNRSGQLGLGLNPGTGDSPSKYFNIGDKREDIEKVLDSVKLNKDNKPYDVSDITLGAYHSCAVINDGQVKCWGNNSPLFKQLGLGDQVSQRLIGRHPDEMGENLGFVQFMNGNTALQSAKTSIVAIDAGFAHTCAVDNAGRVFCWGWNNYGQLGNGNRGTRQGASEGIIEFDDAAVQISAGRAHTCAIRLSGALVCWGDNRAGQLGQGHADVHLKPTPVDLSSAKALNVSCGGSHTCALVEGNTVKCWGDNEYGQLGVGSNEPHIYTTGAGIKYTFGDERIIQVDSGEDHSCALTNVGSVVCWGRNDEGQLGTGSLETVFEPVRVHLPRDERAVKLALGFKHSCALLESGNVICWGYNENGQLGSGENKNIIDPSSVAAVGFIFN